MCPWAIYPKGNIICVKRENRGINDIRKRECMSRSFLAIKGGVEIEGFVPT